jgi:hypothetical protein
LKSGWRDGWRGWIIAGSKFFDAFAKYAFMMEKSKLKEQPENLQNIS